jgi:hypothetical protein
MLDDTFVELVDKGAKSTGKFIRVYSYDLSIIYNVIKKVIDFVKLQMFFLKFQNTF